MNNSFSKTILLVAWLVALSGLALISQHYSGESTQFFGIADDQEQTIRFTSPVEIIRYGFVAGEAVAAGDLIVEVRQPDLEAELAFTKEKIQALKFGNLDTRASMASEVVEQKADLQANLSQLDSQIRVLHAREKSTQSFLRGRQSSEANTRSAVQQEIDSLYLRKRAIRQAAEARIGDLNAKLATSERPIDAQIAEFEKRLVELERQRQALNVSASIDGRVGSVLFKVGDRVPPFEPVLTVHGSQPSFIKGYIHESVLNDIRLQQSVWIQSANSLHAHGWYEGNVQSLGSRIVEFPIRLKANAMAQAWGREVVIELNNHHPLLLGEKVIVQLEQPNALLAGAKNLLAEALP